jgi:hypothetical protein
LVVRRALARAGRSVIVRRYSISGLLSSKRRNGTSASCSSEIGAELAQVILAHLLLLMGPFPNSAKQLALCLTIDPGV